MNTEQVEANNEFAYNQEVKNILYGKLIFTIITTFIFAVVFMSLWLSQPGYLTGELWHWWIAMTWGVGFDLYIAYKFSVASEKDKQDSLRWINLFALASLNMGFCFNYVFLIANLGIDKNAIMALGAHSINIVASSLNVGLKRKVYWYYVVPCIALSGLAFWNSAYFVSYCLLTLGVMATGFTFVSNIGALFTRSLKLKFEKDELVKELRYQKELAEQASISKTKFLAAASHDLRQPLQSLSLLQAALAPHLNTEKQKEILDKASMSLSSLNELLDSLLDISKLDAGIVSVNPTTFDLDILTHQEVEKYRTEIEGKRIVLEQHYQGENTIFSDPVILTRVISNLISNACRYTEQGKINIRTTVSTDTIEIKVSDTGSGIPDDELDKIFTEFYQVDNPERDRTKGLGLGLSIVKRLTDLLGGTLSVESEHGKGSTFTLMLKRTEPPIIGISISKPLTEHDVSQLNILVIDDEIMVRESMSLLLESWGCTSHLASNLDEAIGLLSQRKNKIDALLVDFSLENKVTGLDCIEAIERKLGRTIPALIITGDTSPERVKELESSGMPFTHKPINTEELSDFLKGLS